MAARRFLTPMLVAAGLIAIVVLSPNGPVSAQSPNAPATSQSERLTTTTDCGRLRHAENTLWNKYHRCFEDLATRRELDQSDCYRTRGEALMAMSGPDHARLDLYSERAGSLGCP